MLYLRSISEKDQQLLKNWRMLPEVTKYMYTDPVISDEGQKIWYRSIKYDDTVRYWIITYDNVDIGLLYITDIDVNNKRCNWAYYIADTSFRGKGIGKTIECNVYDYVFNVLKMDKLCCEVFTFNKKVIGLHEHFGSIIEGTRVAHIIKNGKKYDIVEMAILKEKWEQIKSEFHYDVIEFD